MVGIELSQKPKRIGSEMSSFARSDAEQRPDHAGRQYVILARMVARSTCTDFLLLSGCVATSMCGCRSMCGRRRAAPVKPQAELILIMLRLSYSDEQCIGKVSLKYRHFVKIASKISLKYLANAVIRRPTHVSLRHRLAFQPVWTVPVIKPQGRGVM